MNLNDGIGVTDVYGKGNWLRNGRGIKKGKTSFIYFKSFIRDLKDWTVRYPEILSTKKFKFFTQFPIACLDYVGLFNVFIKRF